MTSKELLLASMWPSIRSWLMPAPATIVEIGCGSLGGFVPALIADGYQAVGFDPAAPDGPAYRAVEFERGELPADVQAVIASTSLHHVAEPAVVLDKIAGTIGADGLVIVVEWDWEAFDEVTARWCLDRAVEPDGWLGRRLAAWGESGQPWESLFGEWAVGHGLHSARSLVSELDKRFERVLCRRGPYLFPELSDTTEAEEQRAIESGEIQALRIDYVGRPAGDVQGR